MSMYNNNKKSLEEKRGKGTMNTSPGALHKKHNAFYKRH